MIEPTNKSNGSFLKIVERNNGSFLKIVETNKLIYILYW